MTAEEANIISTENLDFELNNILPKIKESAKEGYFNIRIGLRQHTVNRLRELNYVVRLSGGRSGHNYIISWEKISNT